MKKLAMILAVAGLIVGGSAQADVLKVGPAQTYAHIQNAVDVANPYDIIEVYADTYLRTVSTSSGNAVVKVKTNNLTIMGVGDGDKVIDVAPYGDGGNNTGIAILANNVTISGLTVTFNNPDAGVGIALLSSYGDSLPDPADDVANNCTISDNFVSGFRWGIQQYGSNYYPSSGNEIVGNTLNGNGYGIEVYAAGIDDTLVAGNVAYGNTGGIVINRDFTGDITNVTVEENTLYDNSYAILVADYLSPGGDHGVFENLTITGNDMTNNVTGVYLYVVPDAGVVTANYNNIVTGTGTLGVKMLNSAGSLDAKCNWWGDPAGPDPSEIIGDVDVSTWLDGPYPDGNCIPEPVTIALLAIGGIGVLIRKLRTRA